MKLALEKQRDLRGNKQIPWLSSHPFLENSMAVLIHRPRRVTSHKLLSERVTHLGIHLWCGNCMSGGKKFTFLDAPPLDKILCARCEDAAVKAGLPSSSQLAGRHVHTGGVVAVMRCCDDGGPRHE